MRTINRNFTLALFTFCGSLFYLHAQNRDGDKASLSQEEIEDLDFLFDSGSPLKKEEIEISDSITLNPNASEAPSDNQETLSLDNTFEPADSLIRIYPPLKFDIVEEDFNFQEGQDSLLSESNLDILDLDDFEERIPAENIAVAKKKVEMDFGGNISLQNLFFQESPIYPLQESYYSMLTFFRNWIWNLGKTKIKK